MVVGSAPTYPQGVIDPITDLGAIADGAGHPVPRRCLHGRVPPPVPRPAGPARRAVRLPRPGRDLHVGRRPQVRLRVQGGLGHPVPDPRAGPPAALRDHRLAGRLLRLDGHGRDAAGRARRRGVGGHDAHRPPRLPGADAHGARRGAAAARRHRVDRRPRAAGRPAGHGDGVRRPRPRTLDIFAVGERLGAEGWYLDRQNRPDSLHATVHAGSAATVPILVDDLRRAVARRRRRPAPSGATRPTGRAPDGDQPGSMATSSM